MTQPCKDHRRMTQETLDRMDAALSQPPTGHEYATGIAPANGGVL